VIFRRRFGDIVSRQLDMFEEDYADLVLECETAEHAYAHAPRDYMDLVETGTEVLAELRDNYARTLEEEVAEAYRDVFNRGVLKRLPRFALEIEDL
jgi:hypothetical protein